MLYKGTSLRPCFRSVGLTHIGTPRVRTYSNVAHTARVG